MRPLAFTGEGLFLPQRVEADMNSRLRLLAWQIDAIAYERSQCLDVDAERARGHVAKWEGGGPQNRYERVRFSPWPKIVRRIWGAIALTLRERQTPRS